MVVVQSFTFQTSDFKLNYTHNLFYDNVCNTYSLPNLAVTSDNELNTYGRIVLMLTRTQNETQINYINESNEVVAIFRNKMERSLVWNKVESR